MFTKGLPLFAAAALLATAVSAQNEPAGGNAAGADSAMDRSMAGHDWSQPLNDTFFTDTTRQNLRTESEIRTGWGALDEAEREQVRAMCNAHNAGSSGSADTTISNDNAAAAGADAGAGAGAAAGAGADAAATVPGQAADSNDGGSETTTMPISTANLTQLCTMIQSM